MGKMKELFMEDYEKAAELDQLYIMADDAEWQRELETEIRVIDGRRKKQTDVRQVEIRIKRPRIVKKLTKNVTPIY